MTIQEARQKITGILDSLSTDDAEAVINGIDFDEYIDDRKAQDSDDKDDVDE